MTVIAVFNQKGGVGKTTTSLNLAAALVRGDTSPIAIDLDPQAHLTWACGVKNLAAAESISAFYREEKSLAQLVLALPTGLRLIPSHVELSKIDALYGKTASITVRLKEGLQVFAASRDVPVLIDCCPVLGVLSLNALFAADRVLIPVSADFLSMQGVHRLEAALRALEAPMKRRLERKILLTRFDARRKLSFEIYDRLKERFGAELCDTRIAENVSLAESPARGQDVFAYAPHSPGARDYQALAAELRAKNFV